MARKIITGLCLALILCAGSSVFAASWYVDKNASGSNNGTSWTNAWESFADISWSSVSSGDTVYISGGSSSKTYYEMLTISTSFSNNTTIKRGVDSGHDGDVKIDGGGSRSNCIKISGDYITVDGFHAEDATSYNIYLDGPDHVTVKNCSIHIVSGGRNAIHMRNGTDLTIENNTITTDSGSWETQSDGISSGYNENVVIRNNSITLRNGSSVQHNDCMQMWNTKNVEVYNNYGNQPQNASNQQGIYIEGITSGGNHGTWKVYNNVIEGYFGTAISLQQKNDTAEMHCYNNTAKNLKSRPYAFDGDNVYFKNNIGINADSIRVAVFENSIQSTSRINYNCYYGSGSGDIVTKGGTGYTWSEWQSAGFDASGINQDPSLDSNYKPDSSSDPVVNVGTSLSSHFTTDKDGTSRPQGSAWDMGAYEYTSGGDTSPPSPNPMTWATDPYATGASSISMTATTATDASGVEYYFECTAGGGNDSGWQDSTTYEDTGLSENTQYTYRVKARDKSSNHNETGYSTTKSATTDSEAAPELVSWWKLDESSGTTVADSSGNSHDGTLTGGSWAPTSGKFDGAVDLGAATSDRVEVPTTGMSASAGTVSIWARIVGTQSGTRYFFGHTSSPPSWVNRIQLYMDNSDNQLDLGLGDTHTRATNIMMLNANTWYHIALTWDGTNYVVYVDGISKANGTYTGLSSLGSYADTGNNGGTRNEAFQGLLDEVLVYDQALSKYAVADLASITIASNPSPADEATGVSTTADLSWSAGYYAAETNGHDVYFGTDFNSVADANHSSAEFKGTQSSTTYAPGTLTVSTTYYWAIDEVNDGNTWPGDVWTFATQSGDTTAPSPDPMTWATEPYATGASSISMTATTATDASGVEYYFECTAGGGNSSGWQDSTTYEDTGLNEQTQYSYRVKARDKSSNQNETVYSTTKSATTDAAGATGYKVQSGRVEVTDTTKDVSITAVSDLSRAFVLFSPGTGHANQGSNADEAQVRGWLQATNNVRIVRTVSEDSTWVSYQVIECLDQEFKVYRGSSSMTTSETSKTLSIGGTVTAANCLALVTADNNTDSQDYYSQAMLTARVSSSTQVTIEREDSGNVAPNFNWVVVEFDTGKIDSIQHGSVTVDDETHSSPKTVTISSIDTDDSILIFQARPSTCSLERSNFASNITSSTQIEFYQHDDGDGYGDIEWYVIDFGGGSAQRGEVDNSDGSWLITNVTLSTVDTSHTMCFHTMSCDGAGVAFPRPFATTEFTSSTNLRIERKYSGQDTWNEWQVLELPNTE